jgi:hypothetical protein
MAHFAGLDLNNIVTRILVVPDEQEHRGEEYLRDDLQLGGRWLQTSFNGNIRKNFATVGCPYDSELDAFIPRKQYASWVLDKALCVWVPPVPIPAFPFDPTQPENCAYQWYEDGQDWLPVYINLDAV